MGDWGGAPEGWVPPEERKEREAAAEAAAAMEARRAQADERTGALADAITDGFGMLASAIMAASGHDPARVLDRYHHIVTGTGGNLDDVYTGPFEGMHGGDPDDVVVEAEVVDDDPDMDDLIVDADGH